MRDRADKGAKLRPRALPAYRTKNPTTKRPRKLEGKYPPVLVSLLIQLLRVTPTSHQRVNDCEGEEDNGPY